jgi:sigma-B regulation protein RsbU (phosphoserine phosphatase)
MVFAPILPADIPEHKTPVPEADTLRVLLVEDDPFTLRILHKRLQAGGYQIETATNGCEALDKADVFKPQLILSDWMMPEMDGVELCAQIRKRPGGKSIYFILLTARDKNEDKVSAFDTGADEYLVKPCDGKELMARLRAADRLLRLQTELARSNGELQKAYRRINDEMQATSHIQRSMLPQSLPEVPGYRFAAHYQPSTECSGDFYDLLALEEGRLGIVIGDVSGHGAPAMVAMALTRMLVRMEASRAADPAALLFRVNNLLFEYLPTGQYATMFYGVLDPATGELVYSSAGHNPPLCVDRLGRAAEYLTGCEGFPLKLVGSNMPYETSRLRLAPQQQLILYTDGLVETFNMENEPYGAENLTAMAMRLIDEAPMPLIHSILKDLDQFRGAHPFDDDLSLLIVSRQ